jgi:hypothetical protein
MLCKYWKKSQMEILAMIGQEFGGESKSRTRVLEWYVRFRAEWKKKGETGEKQSQEHAHQAKQSIPHTIVKFYSDCVKICEDIAPNFGDKNWLFASRQSTVSHSPGSKFFLPKTI